MAYRRCERCGQTYDLNSEYDHECLKTFTVWIEGHSATGDYSYAQNLGSHKGKTFIEAVEKAIAGWESVGTLFNRDRLTYWGCHFFDNEEDARRTFG